MIVRPTRLAVTLAAALVLVACESKPPVQQLPEISFADKAPIMLDVGQLEIVSEYQSPARAPNYEHLMQVSPEAAAIRWAKDRLKPMGRGGFARVIIKDASVVKSDLKTDKGLTGIFKEEQAERYDGKLEVQVQILDARHLPVADVTARATRVRSLAQGVTVNDRDKALHEIATLMITDIDSQLDGLIRTYEARWVLP
jgi:hypothetical protein